MAESSNATRYVYAGVTRWRGGTLSGVFRMKVGENRWEQLNHAVPDNAHAQCITVHPRNNDVVFVGTEDGPFRSIDRGEHWEKLPFPEKNIQIWSIAVHPTRPNTIYAGASPVGVFRSEDGGDHWRRMPGSHVPDRLVMGKFVNRVMRMAIDANHPDEMYASMEVNGTMRSTDAGETWEDCNPTLLQLADKPALQSKILTEFAEEGVLDLHSMCMSPAAPRTVFIAGRMGLFRSDDGAKTWQDMELSRFSPVTYGRDVRVSPHDPKVLYACLSVSSHSNFGSIYRSGDLGQTWAKFDHGVNPASTMMALAPDPKDPDVLHGMARSGQVFGTQDGGKSWSESRLPEGCLGAYALAAG